MSEELWFGSRHWQHTFLLFSKASKTGFGARPAISSSSAGTELPLVVESYGLLNDIFPFPSILDAGYPIFNLHLASVLFDVFLPVVLSHILVTVSRRLKSSSVVHMKRIVMTDNLSAT